ncbi:flagell_FliJ, flagellar export protein FliJ [Burkholderiales bacterium]
MSKPWEILGKLAEKKSEDARRTLAQIDDLIQRLEQRRMQVGALLQENAVRLKSPEKRLQMSDIRVINVFMTNLSIALQSIEREKLVLLEHRRRQADTYLKARREEQKMESLQEREDERVRNNRAIADIKQMDAAAIQRFNQTSEKRRH